MTIFWPLVFIFVLLSGCGSSPIHYYSLISEQAPLTILEKVASDKSLGVGPVMLPKLINRPQLVVRVSDSELSVEEKHQWGGRLQEEVQQLLISELQKHHGDMSVYAFPSENRLSPTHQWSVDIHRMDGHLGGDVRLSAHCRVTNRQTREVLFERYVNLKQASVSMAFGDYVASQRDLLVQLAEQCR